MKCPKCGRSAFGGRIVSREKRVLSPGGAPETRTYNYREYRHYLGSRKSITLKALETVLRQDDHLAENQIVVLLRSAREKAGSRVVSHYYAVVQREDERAKAEA